MRALSSLATCLLALVGCTSAPESEPARADERSPVLEAVRPTSVADSQARSARARRKDQRPARRIVEQPASPLQPEVPSGSRDASDAAGAVAPAGGTLDRDGAVTGRFLREGQSVRYAFEADAGELSIFDLGTWGYERGWNSTARITILDAAGNEIVEARPSGGTVYREFLPFTAPAPGTFTLELAAVRSSFRFTLVRHSGYSAREPGQHERDAIYTSADLVHGWLGRGDDRVTYEFDAAPGELVFFRVQNTHAAGRTEVRTERRSAPTSEGGGGRSDVRRVRANSFPRFLVGAEGEEPDAHSFLFRAPGPGPHRITVAARAPNPGGLFELHVTHAPPFAVVQGTVADHEGRPVAGARLRFLREPDFDDLGTTRTDAAGQYSHVLLPGPYTIILAGTRAPAVRTTIDADREVHLIQDGRR